MERSVVVTKLDFASISLAHFQLMMWNCPLNFQFRRVIRPDVISNNCLVANAE